MEVDRSDRADCSAVLLSAPVPTVSLADSAVRYPARVLMAGLATGALSDLLVYGQRVGVGFSLLAFAFVAALLIVYRGERRQTDEGAMRSVRGAVVVPLSLGILFFAIMASLRGGLILQALNVAACLRLGSLLVNRFRAKSVADLTMVELLFGPLQTLGASFSQAGFVIAAVQSDMPDKGRRAGIVKTALRGILLSVVPLAVFIGLLSSADPLFARGANAVVAWLFPTDFVVRLWRIGVASMVAILATGALAAAMVRRHTAPPAAATDKSDKTAVPRGIIGFVESMMVLVSVGAVFAAFVTLQFATLFGGAERVLAVPDLTYAEYARSGFNELVWVAVLALTLISVLRSATRLPEKGTSLNIFRGAATGLIGLTSIVLFSAVQRMNAYEVAYGATATRFAVDMFIAFLALALTWRVATLFFGPSRPTFAAGLLVCAIGFCVMVDMQSPEAAAIRANMARYRSTGTIDTDYLLSAASDDDAIPALCDALRAIAPGTSLRHRLRARLLEKYEEMERTAEEDAWPAANLSRQAARKALTDVAAHP